MSTEILFTAIEQQNMNELATLLKEGTDPDTINNNKWGWSPLHAAIEELESGGPLEALILLLRSGANTETWDETKTSTPLLMALFRNQNEAARLLLAAGANPDVVGSEGDTPLLWCMENNNLDIVKTLLLCGLSETINNCDAISGKNALGIAAASLNVDMVDHLIRAGANPSLLDANYKKPAEYLPERTEENKNDHDEIYRLLSA